MTEKAPTREARAQYLARLAHRTFRHWTAETDAERKVLFEQLPEKTRKAWIEVAITIAHEIWVDSRPPIEPTPIPPRRPRKSVFDLLNDDE